MAPTIWLPKRRRFQIATLAKGTGIVGIKWRFLVLYGGMCSLPYICFLHPRFLQAKSCSLPVFSEAAAYRNSLFLICVFPSFLYTRMLSVSKSRKSDRLSESVAFTAKQPGNIYFHKLLLTTLYISSPICINYRLCYFCILHCIGYIVL